MSTSVAFITLWGHLEGENNTFSITVDKDLFIDHLKEAVKAKKAPRLDHLAADELVIYKLGGDQGIPVGERKVNMNHHGA